MITLSIPSAALRASKAERSLPSPINTQITLGARSLSLTAASRMAPNPLTWPIAPGWIAIIASFGQPIWCRNSKSQELGLKKSISEQFGITETLYSDTPDSMIVAFMSGESATM